MLNKLFIMLERLFRIAYPDFLYRLVVFLPKYVKDFLISGAEVDIRIPGGISEIP